MSNFDPLAQLAPQGSVPLINVAGNLEQCGEQIGAAWCATLAQLATEYSPDSLPWWMDKKYARAIDRYAPHLAVLYQAMARGAGLREQQIGERTQIAKEKSAITNTRSDATGCTSFAIAPARTLHHQTICGQTKDTPLDRVERYQVLRMACTDAPSALTLTYPGQLFGHGFVRSGCSIFRNSLFVASPPAQGLPYFAWGLLALHCKNVDEVIELTEALCSDQNFHCTISDEQGNIAGIEMSGGEFEVLRADDGIYVHANTPRCERFITTEQNALTDYFKRSDSLFREQRLQELLSNRPDRLTAQIAFYSLSDTQGFPLGISRFQSAQACTTAAVVAEPTRGLLHVCRGCPTQNWPVTYTL